MCPAAFAGRRTEMSEVAASGVAPPEVYAPTQRWVISLLGVVVAVQTLPYGVQPILQVGQLATLSATLQVGDKV